MAGRAPILRNTRRDRIAATAIGAACVVAVAGAVFTADIRGASLEQHALPQEGEVQILAEAPAALAPVFTVDNAPLDGVYKPLVAHGLAISNDGHSVIAHQPDGTVAWEYSRADDELCSLGVAWDKVVASYRTGVGCGDVVAIDAATGQYAGTRSAINSDHVAAISSNDRVGTASPERVELWRSDMVRTVEYGEVEAKQEPDLQPHEDCTITSALTRTDLLAVTEVCPDDPGKAWLRLQSATPEDSRAPEISADVALDSPEARLVAVGQEAAAVYVPGEQPRLVSYDSSGQQLEAADAAPANQQPGPAGYFAPATADLPHHMTWFDGNRLYLLTPTALRVDYVFDDAIGTGVAVGDRLLYPTAEGIAVANWYTGQVERSIPLDRGGYTGPVHLSMAGTTIVEARGTQLVGLSPR